MESGRISISCDVRAHKCFPQPLDAGHAIVGALPCDPKMNRRRIPGLLIAILASWRLTACQAVWTQAARRRSSSSPSSARHAVGRTHPAVPVGTTHRDLFILFVSRRVPVPVGARAQPLTAAARGLRHLHGAAGVHHALRLAHRAARGGDEVRRSRTARASGAFEFLTTRGRIRRLGAQVLAVPVPFVTACCAMSSCR